MKEGIKKKTTSSAGSESSKRNSLNETISELENNPEIVKERYKELIEDDTLENPKLIPINPKFSKRRFFSALIFFSVAFFNSYFKIVLPTNEPTQITDFTHLNTEKYYNILKNDIDLRKSLINSTALIQDLGYITLCVMWISKGSNYKPLIAFILFYSFKLINSLSFSFEYIQGYIWETPEYNSLTYPFNEESNFFFTYLIGFNFLLFLFLKEFKYGLTNIVGFTCLFNTIFQFAIFICLRSCYIIDVGSSLLCAHYFYYLSEDVDPYIQSIYNISNIKAEDFKLVEELEREEEIIHNIENEEHCKIGHDDVFMHRSKLKEKLNESGSN